MTPMLQQSVFLFLLSVCGASAAGNDTEKTSQYIDMDKRGCVGFPGVPHDMDELNNDREKTSKCIPPDLNPFRVPLRPPNPPGFPAFAADIVKTPILPEEKTLNLNKVKTLDLNGNSTEPKSYLIQIKISEKALLFFTGPLSTVLIPSFYTVVCVISVPVNILAVVSFACRIRPKKPATIYMLNLACADLVFALLLPFKIFYHFRGNNWIFGPVMCRVVTGAFYWNMYCSVLLITCISVDRLLAVVYPIDSLVWRRPQKAIAACVIMWLLSLAGSVPLVLSEQTIALEELNITTCHDLHFLDRVWHYKVYFITLCCALFFLPLLIIVVSNMRVIWSLSRVPQGVQGSSRRRTRAVLMVLTVLVMFVLCFLPTNCLLLTHYVHLNAGIQENGDSSYITYLVFMCLGSLNCLLDPLVYYFGSSQCQKQLGGMLGCSKITESASFSPHMGPSKIAFRPKWIHYKGTSAVI